MRIVVRYSAVDTGPLDRSTPPGLDESCDEDVVNALVNEKFRAQPSPLRDRSRPACKTSNWLGKKRRKNGGTTYLYWMGCQHGGSRTNRRLQKAIQVYELRMIALLSRVSLSAEESNKLVDLTQ